MREVEAYCGRVEGGEGHLVDGEGAGGGIEVLGRVDVGACMIGEREEVRCGAEDGVSCLFRGVGVPGGYYYGRVRRVGWGAVVEVSR